MTSTHTGSLFSELPQNLGLANIGDDVVVKARSEADNLFIPVLGVIGDDKGVCGKTNPGVPVTKLDGLQAYKMRERSPLWTLDSGYEH